MLIKALSPSGYVRIGLVQVSSPLSLARVTSPSLVQVSSPPSFLQVVSDLDPKP